MSAGARARLYVRVARAEGLRSACARAAERFDEWRRRRSYRLVGVDEWRRVARGARVLNLLPTPPAARLGGVQIQFVRRLAAEARLRACVLLHPERDGWRLLAPAARVALSLGADAPGAGRHAAGFEEVVRHAVELTGTRLLHVENVAGLPLAGLSRLAREGPPLVVSLHDFTLFCPRPLLIEQPAGRFCGYSRDPARCAACLAADGSGERGDIEERRESSARLLSGARALVFPSEFLRARLGELLPVPASVRQAVIAPACGAERVARGAPRVAAAPHVAFVGAARPEKGVGEFEPLAAAWRGRGLRFSAYGGGDPEVLRRLRARGVRVCGHYRAGSLGARLVADRVDVALLLSIGPESYGLTLDECAAAGVPVIVFDAGAPAERVRAWRAGRVVPLGAGVQGVATALEELLEQRERPPAEAGEPVVPTARSAAEAHIELYGRLGASS